MVASHPSKTPTYDAGDVQEAYNPISMISICVSSPTSYDIVLCARFRAISELAPVPNILSSAECPRHVCGTNPLTTTRGVAPRGWTVDTMRWFNSHMDVSWKLFPLLRNSSQQPTPKLPYPIQIECLYGGIYILGKGLFVCEHAIDAHFAHWSLISQVN